MTDNTTHAQAAGILHRAADWLEANPDRHTTGALARTKEGQLCDPTGPDAYCFCAVGRIQYELLQNREAALLARLIFRLTSRTSLARTNDGTETGVWTDMVTYLNEESMHKARALIRMKNMADYLENTKIPY